MRSYENCRRAILKVRQEPLPPLLEKAKVRAVFGELRMFSKNKR